MTTHHFPVVMAFGLVLVASTFAKSTHQPERLHVDGDVQSANGSQGEGVGALPEIPKGILAAIIISALAGVALTILCCCCICRCLNRMEESCFRLPWRTREVVVVDEAPRLPFFSGRERTYVIQN
ncbi:uncharacterized protein LOC144162770 [Haemaphysalis longicornis]